MTGISHRSINMALAMPRLALIVEILTTAYPSALNLSTSPGLIKQRLNSPGTVAVDRVVVLGPAGAVTVGQDVAAVMAVKPTHVASGKETGLKHWPLLLQVEMAWY
jgi:hypothetical protein